MPTSRNRPAGHAAIPALAALILLGAGLPVPARAAVENYRIDVGHSTIGYSVTHFVANFEGHMKKFKGTISFDPADYSTTRVEVTVWANAIDTNNANRDEHLMGPDFFNAAVDSLITFKSTSCQPTDQESGILHGELTLRGVTKPVQLHYTVLGFYTRPDGLKKAGFEATGKINRKDFGVAWNKELDPGNWVLGETVKLNLQIEANLMKPETAPPPAKTP